MWTIRGQTRKDASLEAKPRSQRAPVSVSSLGESCPAWPKLLGAPRCLALHAHSRPLLAHTFPRPPIGLLGPDTSRHTPASAPWGPSLRVQASTALSCKVGSWKTWQISWCPVPMSLEFLRTSCEDGDFFFPIKYFDTAGGLDGGLRGMEGW